jgi:putative transposase
MLKTITSKLTRSNAYQALFRQELDQELIPAIRLAANASLAPGNDKFRQQVEHLTGQRQYHLKQGP